jgi:SPX domain protein involved in polyphosphate accumulation
MVNYGVSLRKARRPGWEDAYLDYEGLKDIRNRLEALLVERDDDIAESLFGAAPDSPYLRKYFELRGEFAEKLHSEIEKVSLFSLNRLGEVANAVGVLRFMSVETNGSESPTASAKYTKQLFSGEASDVEEAKTNEATNYDEFGEKGKHATATSISFQFRIALIFRCSFPTPCIGSAQRQGFS